MPGDSGDSIGATVADSGSVAVGKRNVQQVTNIDARSDSGRVWYDGEMELLHIRQEIAQVRYLIEGAVSRIQQIEIAMQINAPSRSSQGERLFMLLVAAIALLMFAFNAYVQVAR